MDTDSNANAKPEWRRALPVLAGRAVTLREPVASDLAAIVELLSVADASRCGVESPLSDEAVRQFVDRVQADRQAGLAFTYAIALGSARTVLGLIQVRQLDPAFETAEWECTIAPGARGTGIFLEAARLVASFTFASVGTHRLESRVPLQNGRANGALRKLGAVQEGILRRSLRHGGTYFDQVLWSLLKDDWSERRGSTPVRVH